ncbi:hypothetical protein [Amycolatopsis orientalis]|uniref:hypothetical protein n=1 Tax=Amycolatopsis orientalis TaxID=31958 RepID=UPI0003A7B3A6|nr:hypothetical protein [Amycolatopsis orientalis]
MRKSAIVAMAAAIGLAGTTVPAVAAAEGPAADPVTVQLNQDTAVLHGQVNVYQRGTDPNTALAYCPGAKAGTAEFSSPALKFSQYSYGETVGVKATMSASASLVPGTKPGSYPLTVTCGGKQYRATFTVPAPQVSRVPQGAAKAGDGSLAS